MLSPDRENIQRRTRDKTAEAGERSEGRRHGVELARGALLLGTHAAKRRAKATVIRIAAGRAAIARPPHSRGYFGSPPTWGRSPSLCPAPGANYRGESRDALETVCAWIPVSAGSADRALRRGPSKCPTGGRQRKKSEEHLRKSLTYAEQRLFALLLAANCDAGRKERRAPPSDAAAAPVDPSGRGGPDFKRRPRLLATLR